METDCKKEKEEQDMGRRSLTEYASVSITMNRYVHPSMEVKRNNMNRLRVFFEDTEK